MISISDQVYLIPEMTSNDVILSGSGMKKLMIVVDHDSFGDAEKNVLDKMMTAIKYDPENDLFRIIIPHKKNIVLSHLDLKYSDCIIFGLHPEQVGFHIDYKLNDIIQMDNTRLLICESIRDIVANPQKKQLLWTKLQEMFLK